MPSIVKRSDYLLARAPMVLPLFRGGHGENGATCQLDQAILKLFDKVGNGGWPPGWRKLGALIVMFRPTWEDRRADSRAPLPAVTTTEPWERSFLDRRLVCEAPWLS